jgi:8-oxo-dGTP pyrophosphatase MutT (NUDIX family)
VTADRRDGLARAVREVAERMEAGTCRPLTIEDFPLSMAALGECVEQVIEQREKKAADSALEVPQDLPMAEPGLGARHPVAVAIVTSELGVLVGRRADGSPPWTFPGGKLEPGESAEHAAVREVEEETGLLVRATGFIGQRLHPDTRRTLVYVAAEPVNGTAVFVAAEDELADVRWASLREADELLPGMFGPVRDYLARVLPG